MDPEFPPDDAARWDSSGGADAFLDGAGESGEEGGKGAMPGVGWPGCGGRTAARLARAGLAAFEANRLAVEGLDQGGEVAEFIGEEVGVTAGGELGGGEVLGTLIGGGG